MKLSLFFLALVALAVSEFPQSSQAAPNAHSLKIQVQGVKSLLGQFQQFLQTHRQNPVPKTEAVAREGRESPRDFDLDLTLDRLLNYVRWLQDFDLLERLYDIYILSFNVLSWADVTFGDFNSAFFAAWDEGVPQDVRDSLNAIGQEVVEAVSESYDEFTEATEEFWRQVVDDPNNPEPLRVYIGHIEALFGTISQIDKVNHLIQDFVHIFLSPDVVEELNAVLKADFVKFDVQIDEIIQLLLPPAEVEAIQREPTNLSDVFKFFQGLGELNHTSTILGLPETVQLVKAEGTAFNNQLFQILLEAGGVDLENEAKVIVQNFTEVADARTTHLRETFNLFLYLLFHGTSIGEMLETLGEFLESLRIDFKELVPLALSTIEQLQTLVREQDAGVVERTQVLIQKTLDNVQALVEKYAANFNPLFNIQSK